MKFIVYKDILKKTNLFSPFPITQNSFSKIHSETSVGFWHTLKATKLNVRFKELWILPNIRGTLLD